MRAAARGVVALVALGAIAIAWAFAATVLRHTRPMGLPLDDGYVYLTYARQIARGQPFTYFSGGGYSAAASALWPIVLAPLWLAGARGHALVWASFVVSAALYVATAIAVHRIAERIAGGVAAAVAALIVLAIAPFASAALSGTEVALVSAGLVIALQLLLGAPADRPGRALTACLAALSLAHPVALIAVVALAVAAAVPRLRRRDLRGASRWLIVVVAPALWLAATRLATGNWLPSSLHRGPFDGAGAWIQAGRLVRGAWDASGSPIWPVVVAALWLAGAVRVLQWARREHRGLAGAAIVAAPLAIAVAAIVSGAWTAVGYRAIAPAVPALAITVGCAFARLGDRRWSRHATCAAAGVFGAAQVFRAIAGLPAEARELAQRADDLNAQGVSVGDYLQRKLPGAYVLVHDPGAIAYYSDGAIFDASGRVASRATAGADGVPDQLAIAAHGPGALFEQLERLAPDHRPGLFAIDPGWLGVPELTAAGDPVLHAPLRPAFAPRPPGAATDLQLLRADWDHVATGERPLNDHTGWAIVDRIDIADLASEAAHHWSGALGPANPGDPAARWSVVGREVGPHGLILDGGRTIRGGGERFTITTDPAAPIHLVLRTGGARSYRYHEPLDHPVPLRLLDDTGREVARATLPPATGGFAEVTFTLPAGTSPGLHTEASAPYRAFHWFVLQPE